MPEENVRTYVRGMKAAAKAFDDLVVGRLAAEAEMEEAEKQAEKLERKFKRALSGVRAARKSREQIKYIEYWRSRRGS